VCATRTGRLLDDGDGLEGFLDHVSGVLVVFQFLLEVFLVRGQVEEAVAAVADEDDLLFAGFLAAARLLVPSAAPCRQTRSCLCCLKPQPVLAKIMPCFACSGQVLPAERT